jgi:FkbM family methyltransferase
MSKIKALLEYKRTYANWISVLYSCKIKNKKIIKIKLRKTNVLNVPREIVYFIKELSKINNSLNGFDFDSSNEIFTFPYLGKTIKMKFHERGKFNGEFASFLGDYDFLDPIEDNTVIDVGTNIGDSSVWFATKGASIIIGLEPYKWSYNMAIKNIKINNLIDRITILNAGYGQTGEIELEDAVTNIGTELKEYKGGIKTPLFTLADILNRNKLAIKGDLLLKVDCEGCEYYLLNEKADTLRIFKKIIIEYHYGYENLIVKLKECNFDVKYTEPHKWYDRDTGRNLIQGYIYAKRIN